MNRSVSRANAVKFVALPPIRISPICPVVTPPRHVGDQVGSAWQEGGLRLGRGGGELRRHQCKRSIDAGGGGAIDLVGLEQVDPAVDHKGDALLVTVVDPDVPLEPASVMTLLTMMLVPPMIGGPRLITNSLF